MAIWRFLANTLKTVIPIRYYFVLFFVVSHSTGCSSQILASLYLSDKFELPKELPEISGMAISDMGLFALNDSGNGATIYLLDTVDFSIISEYTFKSIDNHDWEEMAINGDSLFIGDFGNNFGNRRDLAIHSISLSNLINNDNTITSRYFRYSGQSNFSNLPHFHRWDCESMILTSGSIYLFSKDWPNQKSFLYKIDRDSTYSSLAQINEIDIGYLVTGTFFDKSNSQLYMCGYLKNSTYISIATISGEMNFCGEIETYIVPELNKHQVESIFVRNNNIYLASEATNLKQSIYILKSPLLDE